MNKIRILLADDHSLMRMGLAALIASEPDMEVVGEAVNGREAIDKADSLQPDVLILDLMMPKVSGAAATKEIHGRHPAIRIVVLTSFALSHEMAEAVRNGACGVLSKDAATDDLVRAIRSVVSGKTVFPKRIQNAIREESETTELTPRQLEILSSVTRGLSNIDIAKQFGITEICVKKHLQSIFERIGAASRTEAAAIALRKHLLKV